MTDFYSQNRCVCSTRSHGPLLYAFCLCFHFKLLIVFTMVVFAMVTGKFIMQFIWALKPHWASDK